MEADPIMQHSRRRRRIIAAVAVPALAGGALLGALVPAMVTSPAPVMATLMANPVPATITIPQTMTLTVSTSSLAFSGSPGGASNAPQVSYQVMGNDANGYNVSVAATGPSMVNQSNGSYTFPVSDIGVFGPAQAMQNNAQPAPVGKFYPVALSTSNLVTASKSSLPANGGDTMTDTYGFFGPNITDSQANPMSNIPSNVPAGTYSDSVTYTLTPN
jgi:hypothetical protein